MERREQKALDRLLSDIADAEDKCPECGGKMSFEEGVYEPDVNCVHPPCMTCDNCGHEQDTVHPADWELCKGNTDLIGRDE